ncbi:nitrate- and nitrite sensing domain-containing protein [Sphaerisporangium sp. TRM90804]|uniref:sensor histidine kinase n=1 Tax=Sphaerisporangium sp. TRM90804 TaxID=3031113 RepID=UPI00244D34DB|nr:nitrate- and nitrite sensing domain-containing protein [Sphaerisporangium sp. TRM90804]MDH2424674.1 nitrate- and nitrite sensing domain-containing protein [Sphaerisporangium sp. TRM90804]
MRFRNSRVRTKVTALLLSLVALWGFAAWVTLREGLNLLWVSTLDTSVSQPAERLIIELQRERRLTLVLLGGPVSTGRKSALTAQRVRSLQAGAEFHPLISDSGVRRAASDMVLRRLSAADRAVRGLTVLRERIDAGEADRYAAGDTFTQVIESIYNIYDGLATLDDQQFAHDTRTLVALARARELLAQEDAFAAGALETGGFGPADSTRFTQIVGAQRLSLERAVAELPQSDRASFDDLLAGDAFQRFRDLEDRLVQARWRAGGAPVDAETWSTTTDTVLTRLDRLVTASGDALVDRATPLATGVIVRLVLAGGLGLLAVIASIILSITTARALVRRLEELRTAALDLAARRLPGVVERLGRGEDVDVAAEAPPLAVGDDAIGEVGRAFNTVQETAIRVAVEQAELRRSYRGILLSLARRTQSLVHRQLTVLDGMERRVTDPGELADLFRVDHLATRMRRNAENLIVLSGASPGRAWRRSVPMVDVVRGALAEIEDYTQVVLMPMGETELAGRAIGDVIHLLAELIENAVSFSPPYATVQVSGQVVANGYVIEIEDRGLGMLPADLALANEQIANPPDFKLTDTPRLGLYVVSRLASRHRIQVTLKPSPYGGTTVVVLLPRELTGDESETSSGAVPAGSGTRPAPGLDAAPGRVERPEWFTRLERDDRALESPAVVAPPILRDDTPDDGHDEPGHAPGPLPEAGLASGPAPGEAGLGPVPEQGRVPAPPAEPVAAPGLPGRRSGTPPQPEPEPVLDAAPDAVTAEAAYTPSGLPRRVAQTHIAPALRQDAPEPVVRAREDDRSPEEIRRLMGAFQSGTERGRSEAERLPGPDDGREKGGGLPKRRR